MFKGKENGKEPRTAVDSGAINTIVSGTLIEGNVTLQGSIRFDGHLKGTLESKGRVVIGSSGLVEGNIICNDADIAGRADVEDADFAALEEIRCAGLLGAGQR